MCSGEGIPDTETQTTHSPCLSVSVSHTQVTPSYLYTPSYSHTLINLTVTHSTHVHSHTHTCTLTHTHAHSPIHTQHIKQTAQAGQPPEAVRSQMAGGGSPCHDTQSWCVMAPCDPGPSWTAQLSVLPGHLHKHLTSVVFLGSFFFASNQLSPRGEDLVSCMHPSLAPSMPPGSLLAGLGELFYK